MGRFARQQEITFDAFFKVNLKRVLTYWSQLTLALGACGTALGLGSLFAYTDAIGRADLFMDSLDAKTSLLVWLAIVFGWIIGYIALLTTTSVIFAASISTFRRIPEYQSQVVVPLSLPVLIGFIAFVVTTFRCYDWNAFVRFLITATSSAVAYSLLFASRKFRNIICDTAKAQDFIIRNNTTNERILVIWVFFQIMLTVMSGAIPMLVILKSYLGEDTPEAVNTVGLITFVCLILTLLPALSFYLNPGSIIRRIGLCFFTVMVISVICIGISPSIISNIAYGVAGALDIRQKQIARYSMAQDYELIDFQPEIWHTKITLSKKLEISAFQLFSFGNVLLLCPANLVDLSLKQWPAYSSGCFSTDKSKAVRKPIHFTASRSPWFDKTICMARKPEYSPMLVSVKSCLIKMRILLTPKGSASDSYRL